RGKPTETTVEREKPRSRQVFLEALMDCIETAPDGQQKALLDALEAWQRTRKNRGWANPLADALLDAIEEGLVMQMIEREEARDAERYEAGCAIERARGE